jgi:hypothetical protein
MSDKNVGVIFANYIVNQYLGCEQLTLVVWLAPVEETLIVYEKFSLISIGAWV